MRCELCNRSMTDVYLDGAGQEHEYCIHCIDEIYDTIDSYDEEDWQMFDPYEYDDTEDYDDTVEGERP